MLVISNPMATLQVLAQVRVKHLIRTVIQHGLPGWLDHTQVKHALRAPHLPGSSAGVFVPLLVVLVVTPMSPKAQHIIPMYTDKNLNQLGISSESTSGEAAIVPSLGDCSAELPHPLIS